VIAGALYPAIVCKDSLAFVCGIYHRQAVAVAFIITVVLSVAVVLVVAVSSV